MDSEEYHHDVLNWERRRDVLTILDREMMAAGYRRMRMAYFEDRPVVLYGHSFEEGPTVAVVAISQQPSDVYILESSVRAAFASQSIAAQLGDKVRVWRRV